MHFVILIILVLIVVFGPQIWARRTFEKYSRHQDHFPGTGGELARHLLNNLGMQSIKVETTDKGDHYDPGDKTVRLSSANYNGKSITAIAVAAHEVGHAIQDYQGQTLLKARTRLVYIAQWAERIGSIAMLGIPVITLITRAPSTGLLMLVIGIASIAISTLVHLVTLPVELDASFGKALPMLKSGAYIKPYEEKGAHKVLTAAAFTYVAASLAALLNMARWVAILRRR